MKKHNLFKIISIAILAFVVLSWIIPTASLSGTTIAKAEELTRIGIWNIFNFFQVSLSSFSLYGVFLICVGAFYIVLNKTEVYQRMIESISKKFSKNAKVFLVITIILFAIVSSVTNIGLMLFIFIPLFVSIILKLGYDKLTAMASTIGAIFVGIIGSTCGYYVSTAVNQVLGLKYTDSLNMKLILLIVSTALLVTFVLSHVKKLKKTKNNEKDNVDPLFIEVEKKSKKASWPLIVILSVITIVVIMSTIAWSTGFTIDIFTKFHEAVMKVKIGSFEIFKSILGGGVNVGYYTQYGIKALGEWDYTDLSIILVLSSFVISLIYKVKFSDFLDSFAEGLKKFIKPAFLIVLAYTLFVLNYYIPVFTTIISWFGKSFNIITSSIVALLSSFINIDMMYVAQGTLATVSTVIAKTSLHPILAVLYQSMYGLAQFIAPTSALLIAGLCYFNVSYKEWFKFIWKLLIELLVIILLVLIIMMMI